MPANFTHDANFDVQGQALTLRIAAAVTPGGFSAIDATDSATKLMGDSIAANLFTLGYAWQKGLVPLTRESIAEAVQLNAVSVKMNLAAFAWGRRAAVDEASKADTYVLAHAYTPKAISRAVRCGVRTIEHGNLIDADSAQVMADHGAIAVPTIVTYEALASEGAALGLPPESVAKIENVRSAALRSLEIFAAAGVRMAFGTDLLGESHRLQSDEFRLRAGVLGAAETLRAATIHAAHVLRMDGRLGVVAPGATADLLLVDGNPLQDISVLLGQGEGLAMIVQEGKVVKDH
jgi:imidazolonepropionase-like amidohydrolase